MVDPHRPCYLTRQGWHVLRPQTTCYAPEMRCWPRCASAFCRPSSSLRSITMLGIRRFSSRWATGCGYACCTAPFSPSIRARMGSWDLTTPFFITMLPGLFGECSIWLLVYLVDVLFESCFQRIGQHLHDEICVDASVILWSIWLCRNFDIFFSILIYRLFSRQLIGQGYETSCKIRKMDKFSNGPAIYWRPWRFLQTCVTVI
jgi:hypothetical protein